MNAEASENCMNESAAIAFLLAHISAIVPHAHNVAQNVLM